MSTKQIQEVLALAAELDAMAKDADTAESLIERLATGFFPGGADLKRLTWGDTGPSAPGETTDVAERLRAAEARFRTLIEQIPAVTFMAVLGEGKNEIYVSPHVEAMLGFTQEEWLADPFLWYSQLHVDDRKVWNEEFARGCRTGGPFRAECRFLARDGHTVWVHGEARLVRDDIGRPQFLQGVAFDITEAKRAQELLLNEAVWKAKAEEELAIARRVQTSVLPRNLAVEGLEIAAAMFPASEVGGDYYDVIPFPGGSWIGIGDVSGHGLNSGLIMLMLQSALSALTRGNAMATPREVVLLLNEVMYENIRSRLQHDDHITFTLLKYTKDGRVSLSGAHEDILICRKRTRKLEIMRPSGTWIGARPDISRVTVDSSFFLEDGDLVVLYTDGVTEAMSSDRRQFDIERLWDAVERLQDERPEVIRDKLLVDVRAWMHEQDDDMTLLVMRHTRT